MLHWGTSLDLLFGEHKPYSNHSKEQAASIDLSAFFIQPCLAGVCMWRSSSRNSVNTGKELFLNPHPAFLSKQHCRMP
jgi:hypothetical protein